MTDAAPAAQAQTVTDKATIRSEAATADALVATRAADEATLRTEGQRRINLLWENTQMKVALSVIWASLAVAALLASFGRWVGSPDLQLAAVVFLFGVANLVTGFYFGRTNHQRIGGVGGDDERGR